MEWSGALEDKLQLTGPRPVAMDDKCKGIWFLFVDKKWAPEFE